MALNPFLGKNDGSVILFLFFPGLRIIELIMIGRVRFFHASFELSEIYFSITLPTIYIS